MRLEEQSEVIWETYPREFLDIAILVTDLGDVTAIVLFLSVLYWVSDRKQAALLASYGLVGVSAVLLVKTAFGLPRPGVEIVAREYDQYGFPSAHAFMSVVVYGGALYVFERYRNPLLVGGVGALVAAISLSRVVLGIHYLADVLVGALLGLLLLPTVDRVTGSDPTRGFGLGAVLAVAVVVVTTGEATTLGAVTLGSAVGGLAGTVRLDSVPPLRTRAEAAVLVVVGLGYVLGIGILESVLAGGDLVLVAVFHGLLIGGVFSLPVAVGRIQTSYLSPDRLPG